MEFLTFVREIVFSIHYFRGWMTSLVRVQIQNYFYGYEFFLFYIKAFSICLFKHKSGNLDGIVCLIWHVSAVLEVLSI